MKQKSFKDNFSGHSELYAKYRPRYPKDLYEFLAILVPEHELAWDCGTGNGQAAIDLAAHFKKIIATDPSEEQIRHAIPNEQISYRVEQAEHSSLDSNSVDLIVAANSLHWMDFDRFYQEVHRTMKKGAIFAAWTYKLPVIDIAIDTILHHFHYQTLGGYWLPENELIDKGYSTIPFPFSPVKSPRFFFERKMNLEDFIAYINTWSATQRFIKERHFNPTEKFKKEILNIWGAEERILRWELIVKVGRN